MVHFLVASSKANDDQVKALTLRMDNPPPSVVGYLRQTPQQVITRSPGEIWTMFNSFDPTLYFTLLYIKSDGTFKMFPGTNHI
jgi:hypothetical protein